MLSTFYVFYLKILLTLTLFYLLFIFSLIYIFFCFLRNGLKKGYDHVVHKVQNKIGRIRRTSQNLHIINNKWEECQKRKKKKMKIKKGIKIPPKRCFS